MTKTEYLNELNRYLKRLPKADYEEAIAYFQEYFDDVGPENESLVMQELGAPKEAAFELISNLVDDKLLLPKTIKLQIDTIWLTIALLISSPITKPLLLAFIALIFAAILVFISIIVTGISLALASLVASICTLIDSLSYLQHLSTFIMEFGTSLFLIGLGLLIGLLTWVISQFALQTIVNITHHLRRERMTS